VPLRETATRYAKQHLPPRALDTIRSGRDRVQRALRPRSPLDEMPVEDFVTWAYRMVLRREADPAGRRHYEDELRTGAKTRRDVLDVMRGSEEFRFKVPFVDMNTSLHQSRCDFVRSLPRARRIVDLGGTHQSSRQGAFVHLGYPYPFDELTIIDLPHEERHEIYRHSEAVERVETELGPVFYRYHSMTDLSLFPDETIDLVYAGQTIEHVTPADADVVMGEVRRILRPGGWFAFDTPNGPVCRMQQADFINPDHKVEYSHQELAAKVTASGLELVAAWGLNYLGHPAATVGFDPLEVAGNSGMYFEAGDCYLLAYVCRKSSRSG